MYKTSIDELAAAMEEVLNDKDYRNIFERPQIKMASAEEPVVEDKNTVEHAYDQLVEASKILDELGLFKSSELALSAVETLLAEAAKCCKSDCKKCTDDDECKCCCAGDSNDVADKDKDDDDKDDEDSACADDKKPAFKDKWDDKEDEKTQDVKPGEKPGEKDPTKKKDDDKSAK